jgi:hypothetical protein
MAQATSSAGAARQGDNVAAPHAAGAGDPKRLPLEPLDHVGPSLGIHASIDDLVAFLRVNLAGGKLGDQRIVSRETIAALHRPRVLSEQVGDESITPIGHALGWTVDEYRGHRRLHQRGRLPGYTSAIALLPAEGVGIAIVANRDRSPLVPMLLHRLTDRTLDLELHDWQQAAERIVGRAHAERRSAIADRLGARRSETEPAHDEVDYVGVYRHPAYGTVEIRRTNGRLVAAWRGMEATLEHWHYETFRAADDDDAELLAGLPIQFRTDMAGEVATLAIPLEPAVEPIVFRRES